MTLFLAMNLGFAWGPAPILAFSPSWVGAVLVYGPVGPPTPVIE